MEEEVKNEENQEESKKEATKEETTGKTGGAEEKPLDKMTTPELKEIAKQIPGMTGVTAMKKDQLLAAIKEYRGIKDEEPAKKVKKKTPKKALNVKDLKKKVIQLKGEKKAVQEAKDKKQSNILRRRINRMKKRTRKVAQA
jgi:hypothetical protein